MWRGEAKENGMKREEIVHWGDCGKVRRGFGNWVGLEFGNLGIRRIEE
jgi:hypothetical protein